MGYRIEAYIEEFRYPDSDLPIIEKFSLSISADEFVSIIGPSGVGKTTLLRILAGLELNYSGTIKFDDKIRKSVGRDVQILFQDSRLLPWRTAVGNVAFAYKKSRSAITKQQASALLEQLGLAHRENAWPKALSGGEKTRIAFARALAPQPQVLLLDEPMRDLDIANKNQLSMMLRRPDKPASRTSLMISHDVEDAVTLSDRLIIVSGNPMSISHEIQVSLGYPRDRRSHEFHRIVENVKDVVLGVISERPPEKPK